MKILLRLSFSLVILSALMLLACEKKTSTGIAPTYGSTGNPDPGNNTVTGNVTYTNPATENSSMQVGGTGWSNPTCATNQYLMLKGYRGSAEVTLTFPSTIKTGTYDIAVAPITGQCAMTVVNADEQPPGLVWYGKSGKVYVMNANNSWVATFPTAIICTQKTFNFPIVAVSGTLNCGQ